MNATKLRVAVTDWTFTILSMKIFRDQERNDSMRSQKRLATFWAVVMFLAALASVPANAAVTVAPAEMEMKTDWLQKNLLAPARTPPFSFTFGGKFSAALLRPPSNLPTAHSSTSGRK